MQNSVSMLTCMNFMFPLVEVGWCSASDVWWHKRICDLCLPPLYTRCLLFSHCAACWTWSGFIESLIGHTPKFGMDLWGLCGYNPFCKGVKQWHQVVFSKYDQVPPWTPGILLALSDSYACFFASACPLDEFALVSFVKNMNVGGPTTSRKCHCQWW